MRYRMGFFIYNCSAYCHMLLVILSWIYIAFIFFALGLSCFRMIMSVTGEAAPPHVTLVLVAGMIATTFIASGLSLFMPLGLAANLLLLSISLAALFFCRRSLREYLAVYRAALRPAHWPLWLLFVGYALILAYLSVELPSHHDNGLYYATTIQWIEQYGVVKGLANVNPRIGFNSNWHLLQALFSFPYLHNGYLSNINGLLLLMVFPYSLGGIARMWKRDYSLPVILRSMMFIPLVAFHFGASSEYIFFNINFISSPVADLAVCLLIWLTLTLFIEMDGLSVNDYNCRALLVSMMAVFMFTVKPSAAPVLLACIFLFFAMAWRRQWRVAVVTSASVMLIALPWLARNVTITGYLLFPFEGIDIFDADWKLPLEQVRWHANAVKSYAADPGYDLSKPFTRSVPEWFPGWFSRLAWIQSAMLIAAMVSLVVCVGIFIAGFVQRGRHFITLHLHTIFVVIMTGAGMAFWFLKGPDFRLGYGFIGMAVMLLVALMVRYFLRANSRYAGYLFTAVLFFQLFYYYRGNWEYMPKVLGNHLPPRRMPESMGHVDMGNGIRMNLVYKQDAWYAPLPIANNDEFYTIRPVPRGKSMAEGFKPTEK
jgi:hypothetical protein